MFAIIENGGKQYKIAKDGLIELEKLNVKTGSDVVVSNVLLVAQGDTVEVGRPYVKGAKIILEAIRGIKARKVISFKYRRRKSSKTTKGHRQKLSLMRVKDIKFSLA